MEEKMVKEEQTTTPESNIPEGEILSVELLAVVADIILEFKKSGSIKTSQLFDKLDKYETTPIQLEEIYKIQTRRGDSRIARKPL